MHKRLLNEATVEISIQPNGPILIKAGEKGADPTLPDMEFVRTNGKPYLPGSSLKGVIRSHCERIARTVDPADRREQTREQNHWLSCIPVRSAEEERKLPVEQVSCGRYWDVQKERRREDSIPPEEIYRRSCFVCRLFGNTALASRFYLTDAQPFGGTSPRTEERNGVAIDRVFGSVAVGPFNYETVIEGTFRATLLVRNFGLAQLGLLALALRDVQQQRVRIGFGKSRGLGTVTLNVESLTIRYPTCELKEGGIRMLGGERVGDGQVVLGVGAFPGGDGYDFAPKDKDIVSLLEDIHYGADDWDTPEVCIKEGQITAFWRACVGRWREEVERWTQRERRGS